MIFTIEYISISAIIEIRKTERRQHREAETTAREQQKDHPDQT